MLTRILSAIVMIALTLSCIYFGGIWVKLFVLLITGLGSFEYFRALKKIGKKPMVLPIALLLLPSVLALFTDNIGPFSIKFGFSGEFNFYPAIIMLAMATVMCSFVLFHKKFKLEDGALSFFGGFYITAMFFFSILLRNFNENGLYYVLLALIGPTMTDTFALICGRLFGKRKLCPEISPKKTVAGSIGGTVFSIIFCIVYGIVLKACNIDLGFSVVVCGILGLLYGVVAQIGDLFASAIKRECGIKDFSHLIPGHGGVLDRVDSIGLAMVVTYYCVSLLS